MKDQWRVKGGRRKKGDKAYAYADLIWDNEPKVQRFTLETLCKYWNIMRLLEQKKIKLGEPIFHYRKNYKLSHTKKMTLFYAYLVFKEFLQKNLKLKTKRLKVFTQYLMALSLVQNARFITCKELFSFFQKDLPKLKSRHAKNPKPLDHYKTLCDQSALPHILSTHSKLQDKDKLQSLLNFIH